MPKYNGRPSQGKNSICLTPTAKIIKKFIALLFSIVLSFNALFAQRLNSKGQQMVSSIKVYNNINKHMFTFSFYYDEQNRLVKMTNNGLNSNYEST